MRLFEVIYDQNSGDQSAELRGIKDDTYTRAHPNRRKFNFELYRTRVLAGVRNITPRDAKITDLQIYKKILDVAKRTLNGEDLRPEGMDREVVLLTLKHNAKDWVDRYKELSLAQ